MPCDFGFDIDHINTWIAARQQTPQSACDQLAANVGVALVPLALPKLQRGIYFLMAGESLAYIGKSVDAVARMHAHINKGRIPFTDVLFMPYEHDDLGRVEAELIRKFRPPYNRCENPDAMRVGSNGRPNRMTQLRKMVVEALPQAIRDSDARTTEEVARALPHRIRGEFESPDDLVRVVRSTLLQNKKLFVFNDGWKSRVP